MQLCKGFNLDHGHCLMYDYHTANLPLHFTLFKYARSDLLKHKPLRFNIKLDDCKMIEMSVDSFGFVLISLSLLVTVNIFKECYDVSESLNATIKNGKPISDLEKIITVRSDEHDDIAIVLQTNIFRISLATLNTSWDPGGLYLAEWPRERRFVLRRKSLKWSTHFAIEQKGLSLIYAFKVCNNKFFFFQIPAKPNTLHANVSYSV